MLNNLFSSYDEQINLSEESVPCLSLRNAALQTGYFHSTFLPNRYEVVE